MTAVVFDTETTGLIKHPRAKDEVQPRIIELAALLVEDGEVVEELELLINPGQQLPPEIVKITGITDADLADAPSFVEVAPRIKAMFERADVMVAHNLPFDKGMLELDLRRAGMLDDWLWPPVQICTVQEHVEEWGYRPKLLQLYEHYVGQPLNQTHRALDDVRALLVVAQRSGVLS